MEDSAEGGTARVKQEPGSGSGTDRDTSFRDLLATVCKAEPLEPGSCGPDALGVGGPDWNTSQAGFGPQAGLYTLTKSPEVGLVEDSRARLTRHYTEDIPDISLYEIRMALKQLKNNKAPGEDGITAELLKAGGKPVLMALQKLFDSVLLEGRTPKAWNRGVVVLFFKKGDNALLKNYRPISLLSHVYKLFSRVITNRLARRLDNFQPPEQAGFRRGFSTVDHIHTLRQVIQKTEEYNLPLCLAFVDYEKAFDSIETWAVLQSLQRCQVDYRYIEVLKCLYENATMSVRLQDRNSKPIPLQRGVRQGDVISPKLFTAALEDVFKTLDWRRLGININGEYITHLRFADDIVILAETTEDLSMMLDDLNNMSHTKLNLKYIVLVTVKEEAEFVYEGACVKEECEDSTDGCGVSEAAMLAGLYDEHEVKEELVLGPERPYHSIVAPVLRAPVVVSGRRRSCSVRLECLLVDAERRTCRVGRRTYKLHATEPAPTPHVTTAINQCHHCGKRFRNKSVLKKHIRTHLLSGPSSNSTGENIALDRLQMSSKDRKPYKFTLYSTCEYMSNKKGNLRDHQLIHTGDKPFQCRYCDHKSYRKGDVRRHEMTHTGEKPFNCNYCDYKCIVKATLREHLITHTGEKPFKCRYCEHRARDRQKLRTHEMTHTDDKQFKCSSCDYQSNFKFHLQRHLMIHNNSEKPHECRYCDYRSRRRDILRRHEIIHTGDKPFKCNYCEYKCTRNTNLLEHLMIHTGEKPFKCRYCDYRSRRRGNLRAHEMTHTGKKPLDCGNCDFKCKSKTELRRHQMIHTGDKPFKCSYCDHRTRDRRKLRTHEMTHTDDKPFKCSSCDYQSNFKCHLQRHLMIHNNSEKPHKCRYCDYRSRRRGDLRRHEIIHTGDKPFKCNYCEYKCTRKSNLLEHVMIHTGEKPFMCRYCDYRSRRRGNLENHELTHTGKNDV
ncbi:zinc finger protein 135-like [Cydia splendana]|uniref:zinc finger protein 135-like n=1 Tax=Cydia splendana TaxID=1100963 RepID=UPI00300C75A0